MVQRFLYNVFLLLYSLGIRLTALFNKKAALWVAGRKKIFRKIQSELGAGNERRIWVHCSSLGEFEQGRPVMEALKKDHPNYKIVLTFFSPSGYEIRKHTDVADYVFYLPMDSSANAKRFIQLISPSLAIFVKYEFWFHYLNQLKKNNIPTILISAAFRKEQIFFKWHGGLFRRMLKCFNHFFVQDEQSKQLLASINIDAVSIAGDTRYDRVAEIATTVKKFPIIEEFANGNKLLIAGSTWPADEQLLKEAISSLPHNWKLVIAPHEIDEANIKQVEALFGDDAVLYSKAGKDRGKYKVLIIDNIGMLSSLYNYGDIAFIGGGFNKSGIHNILEPAVFGLPVFFGPVYEKFVEAKEFVALQFAYPVNDSKEFNNLLQPLVCASNDKLPQLQTTIRSHMQQKTGATEAILTLLKARYLG